MLSMFKEKDCEGKAVAHWSMTRVVAFLAAMTLNYALIVMSNKDHVHDIAWPFCVMYIVTLLAVPVQMLFKFLQAWFSSLPGKAVFTKLMEMLNVKAADLGFNGSSASTPDTKVTSTTKIEQGDTSGV